MNNFWNFNGTNGNLNNNNVNNSNSVQGVANLLDGTYHAETDEEMFVRQMELVFNTQRNKRRGHDSLVYERHIIPLTVKGLRKRRDKTLRIEHNYAFLTPLPKWREIMATEFEGRKIDHEICDVVMPIANMVLSPYTYNNRIGKGSMAAINQLMEHIYEVTEGYTKPARIIKIDFKGYFPNAVWDWAERCTNEVIDLIGGTNKHTAYLKWLVMIAIHCNPARHCELKTPRNLWAEHIPEEKSILHKDEGIGAAIGRLVWQTAMGLYINDIIKWLTDDCGIKLVCFVDDIVMVVPEERHQYALSLLPVLRERLAEWNIKLNEKKFYDQPYSHGLEFLGSHLKNHRLHINNSTFNRAVHKVQELNKARYKDLDAMVSSFNSYTGLMKNRTDYKRILILRDMLAPEWWQYLNWDRERLCIVYKENYSVKARLNRKYNLNITLKKKKKDDKNRTTGAS